MKSRYIDAVIAANRDGRSIALATELKSGAQFLIGEDLAEGDLALDDAAKGAIREALRIDRNTTLETPEGRVLSRCSARRAAVL